MLAFSGIVAGSFSLGAIAAEAVLPLPLTWARFVIAGTLMAALVAVTGLGRRRHLRAPWRYLALGALFALYFVTMFEALEVGAPVALSAVFTLTPVMSAGFGWLLLRQRTTPRMGLALALAGAGALWVIFDADWRALAALSPGPGEAIFFVGCVAHAAYAPLVPFVRRDEPVPVLTLGTFACGALVLAAAGPGQIAATAWGAVPPLVWAILLYLSIAASCLSVMLVQFAALRLPGAKVMAYTYLIPAWVILWESALGRPLPPAPVLAGIALVVGGLVLLLKD